MKATVELSYTLLNDNSIIFVVIILTSAGTDLHFYIIREVASVYDWLYNDDPYELIVQHFLLDVVCYMGCDWELN